MELKEKISDVNKRLKALDAKEQGKEQFLSAIRKFMEMRTLTAPLLRELVDHIEVYETEGTGKNRTQRIAICYRFVGYVELPDSAICGSKNYKSATRQGVAVEYIPKPA